MDTTFALYSHHINEAFMFFADLQSCEVMRWLAIVTDDVEVDWMVCVATLAV